LRHGRTTSISMATDSTSGVFVVTAKRAWSGLTKVWRLGP